MVYSIILYALSMSFYTVGELTRRHSSTVLFLFMNKLSGNNCSSHARRLLPAVVDTL